MHDRGSRLVLQKAHLSFGALQAAPPAARSLPMRALRQAPLPGACPASARRHDLAMPFLRLWGAAGHPGSSGGPLARVMPARALAGWAPAPRPAPAPAGILGALLQTRQTQARLRSTRALLRDRRIISSCFIVPLEGGVPDAQL